MFTETNSTAGENDIGTPKMRYSFRCYNIFDFLLIAFVKL